MSKMISLSDRLRTAAGMVTPGNKVVDVGCDHGFVSIYLVQQGISPRCLAMDVRTGPLSAAGEHVAQCGLQAYIETRLSDGLKAYEAGEAKTMICCGMGGPLMAKIISDSYEKTRKLSELILQPQSEIPEFRVFLRENGYLIVKEDMVYEEGKYYFLIKAIPVENSVAYRKDAECCDKIWAADGICANVDEAQVLFDWFGKDTLLGRHPVLKQYLEFRLEGIEKIRQQLEKGSKERVQEEETGNRKQESLEEKDSRTLARLQELDAEKALIDRAFTFFK